MIGLPAEHLSTPSSLGSLYALAALGVGLLFGILRLVNFAHGDFISIGAYALIVPSFEVTAQLFIGTWSRWSDDPDHHADRRRSCALISPTRWCSARCAAPRHRR